MSNQVDSTMSAADSHVGEDKDKDKGKQVEDE